MTDWLELCRDAMADVDAVLADLPTRVEREPVLRLGEGGDETTAVDAAAEDAVLRRLRELGIPLTVVSEEVGELQLHGGGGPRVVVDPIDGSLNAKRGIPFFSLSIAVADGPTMGDVVFGYVYDFGSREEWTASRGGGAFLDGERLGAVRPKDEIEILSFEATTTAFVVDKAAAMTGVAHRLRIMGSLALSLCHLAAGRVDAVCSLKPARSVDIAAGQLLVRECGLALELVDQLLRLELAAEHDDAVLGVDVDAAGGHLGVAEDLALDLGDERGVVRLRLLLLAQVHDAVAQAAEVREEPGAAVGAAFRFHECNGDRNEGGSEGELLHVVLPVGCPPSATRLRPAQTASATPARPRAARSGRGCRRRRAAIGRRDPAAPTRRRRPRTARSRARTRARAAARRRCRPSAQA